MILWVWQYRSTRQKANIYPVDSFGGYTTELAGPATAFFLILTVEPHRLRRRADRRSHRLGAEVLMEASPQPSALPYVAWSSSSVAVIPAEQWPLVFGSMQALKGHVQEYPGCQKLEAFVAPSGSDYHVHCYTTWDTPEQLDAFLERGYTFERMLADVAGLQAEPTLVMEKVF